jgi:hypothetical protein
VKCHNIHLQNLQGTYEFVIFWTNLITEANLKSISDDPKYHFQYCNIIMWQLYQNLTVFILCINWQTIIQNPTKWTVFHNIGSKPMYWNTVHSVHRFYKYVMKQCAFCSTLSYWLTISKFFKHNSVYLPLSSKLHDQPVITWSQLD